MKTIFVSSTFRDFQQERDLLRNRVLPELNALARPCGESVSFCDLRWGVDTSGDRSEEESAKTVLSVCLNEIDRSKPYMIVLLGDRYGYVPGETAIGREAGRRELALDDLSISVTALEIEYGALQNRESLEHTFFYFRETGFGRVPPEFRAESAGHARKLRALKKRVQKLAGDHVRFYSAKWDGEKLTGLDKLADAVTADVQGMLRSEWDAYAKMDQYQRDSAGQWNYLREKARVFCANGAFAKTLETRIAAGDAGLTVVSGAAGSGKSTLLARVCCDLQSEGWTVLPFACGVTPLSTEGESVLKNAVRQLERLLGQTPLEDTVQTPDGQTRKQPVARWRERLETLAKSYAASGKKLLLAVDAADQMAPGELRDRLLFLPGNPGGSVQALVTCSDDFRLPAGVKALTMPVMDADAGRAVVDNLLRTGGKQLDETVKSALLKKPAANNPLFLYLAVSRLALMNAEDFSAIAAAGNDMSAISARQLRLVAEMPEDPEAMAAALADEAAARVDRAMLGRAAEYLAVSRRGLRADDLAALSARDGVPFSRLKFSQFVNFMNELFLLRTDGRFDFLHKSLRAGILARCKDEKAVHVRLLAYLKTLPETEPVRMGEIVWHAIRADDPLFLTAYLEETERKDCRPALAAAEDDVWEQARSDGGEWFCALLASPALKTADDLPLVRFFSDSSRRPADDGSRGMLEAAVRVLEANVRLAERLDELLRTPDSAKSLAGACFELSLALNLLGGKNTWERSLAFARQSLSAQRRAGDDSAEGRLALAVRLCGAANRYAGMGGEENLHQALALIGEGEQLLEQLTETAPDLRTWRVFAGALFSAGELYRTSGGRENDKQALLRYEKARLVMQELVKSAGSFGDMETLAMIYESLFRFRTSGELKDLDRALEFCDPCLSLYAHVAEKRGYAADRAFYARFCGEAGRAYLEKGGPENLKRAEELCEKALSLEEARAGELATADSFRGLSAACAALAEVLDALGGDENGRRALALYERSLAAAEPLAGGGAAPEDLRKYGTACNDLGFRLKNRGGKENLQRALDLFRKAQAVFENPASAAGAGGSAQDLIITCYNIGLACLSLGGAAQLAEGRAALEKGVSLAGQREAARQTPENRTQCAKARIALGRTLAAQGGEENLRRARELMENGRDVLADVNRKTHTPASSRELIAACFHLGEYVLNLGGPENRKDALLFFSMAEVECGELVKEQNTAHNRRLLMYSEARIAITDAGMNDRDYAEIGLGRYKKALDHCEALVRDYNMKTDLNYRAMLRSKTAALCRSLGGEENLAFAAELEAKPAGK